MTEQDKYFDDLERKAEKAEHDKWAYGGGYEASRGDWEGACLARAEYDEGDFS